MKIERRWRSGFQTKGIKVDVAWGELESIRKERGQPTPEDVVERARSPKNPLHGWFEWNDTKAAQAFRLRQASNLIQAIEVVYDDAEPVREYARLDVDDPDADVEDGEAIPRRNVYVPMLDALADPTMRDQVIDKALAELRGWTQRWKNYKALAEVAADVLRAIHRKTSRRRKAVPA